MTPSVASCGRTSWTDHPALYGTRFGRRPRRRRLRGPEADGCRHQLHRDVRRVPRQAGRRTAAVQHVESGDLDPEQALSRYGSDSAPRLSDDVRVATRSTTPRPAPIRPSGPDVDNEGVLRSLADGSARRRRPGATYAYSNVAVRLPGQGAGPSQRPARRPPGRDGALRPARHDLNGSRPVRSGPRRSRCAACDRRRRGPVVPRPRTCCAETP